MLAGALLVAVVPAAPSQAASARPVVTRVSAPLMTVDGGSRVTVVGSRFTHKSKIVIGGVTRKTTFISSRKLKATAPPATSYGDATVRVRTGKLVSRKKAGATIEYTNRLAPGSAIAAASFARCERLQSAGHYFLRVTADPPIATGPDIRSSLEDFTFVRYQALLVFVPDGNVHKSSSWSDWISVSELRAGTWTGVSSLISDTELGSYLMQYRFEWAGPVGSDNPVSYGTNALQVPTYNSFTIFNVGPIGPFSACAALL